MSVADFDLDFHFDPVCPFAWLTSRWITRVVELEGIRVNWPFISLDMLNEHRERDEAHRAAHMAGRRYLRTLASIRDREGPGPIAGLYTAWGEHLFQRTRAEGGGNAPGLDIAEVLRAAAADDADAVAADDERWDAVLRAETDGAIERTGADVGTPILVYRPGGNALFGPVISSLPDDDTAVAMYRAMRTLVDFETFSEVKRSKRPPLDLPAYR